MDANLLFAISRPGGYDIYRIEQPRMASGRAWKSLLLFFTSNEKYMATLRMAYFLLTIAHLTASRTYNKGGY